MASWLDRLQQGMRQAQDAVKATLEREQAALVLGKTAGRTVTDRDGHVVVEAGQTISDETVERAIACGMLSALVASVAAASVQDVQERLAELRAATPEGAEQHSLDTVEEYAEARQCVGRVASLDVTDVRGSVVIRSGTRIREEDVRRAREAGLLNALIHSVSVPPPAAPHPSDDETAAVHTEHGREETPPQRRPRLPLLDPNDDRRP